MFQFLFSYSISLYLLHSIFNISLTSQDGTTPISIAAQNGHAAAVELLASSGADLDKPDSQGSMPANLAAWIGHVDVLAVLRDKGADLNKCDEVRRRHKDKLKDFYPPSP